MRRTLIAALTLSLGVVLAMNVARSEKKPAEAKKLLRHVVLFKFKEDAPKKKVQEIAAAFAALPSKIDAIHDFEWGTDVSVENKTAGFTHGFVVTFRDEKGRSEYLPHADHQAFVTLLRPHLDDVLVFDYWVHKP
jgi:hypothetical protein